MVSLRVLLISRRRLILYLASLTFIVSLKYYFAFQPQKAKEVQGESQRLADDFKTAFMKRQNRPFLTGTRTNSGKTSGSAVCVVDPAITDCNQRSLRDSTISHGVCVGEMLVLKAICDALTHCLTVQKAFISAHPTPPPPPQKKKNKIK